MTRQEAYEMVVDDIMNGGCRLLQGHYDAKNGEAKFMHGISTVLEYLAIQVSEEKYNEVSDKFLNNMIESEKRV